MRRTPLTYPPRLPIKHQPAIAPYIASSMVPARAGLSDDAAKARMAEDMRDALYREGGLTREGLELLGYTAAQIDRLASAARTRANRLAAATA